MRYALSALLLTTVTQPALSQVSEDSPQPAVVELAETTAEDPVGPPTEEMRLAPFAFTKYPNHPANASIRSLLLAVQEGDTPTEEAQLLFLLDHPVTASRILLAEFSRLTAESPTTHASARLWLIRLAATFADPQTADDLLLVAWEPLPSDDSESVPVDPDIACEVGITTRQHEGMIRQAAIQGIGRLYRDAVAGSEASLLALVGGHSDAEVRRAAATTVLQYAIDPGDAENILSVALASRPSELEKVLNVRFVTVADFLEIYPPFILESDLDAP